MGSTKRHIELEEEKRQVAIQIALSVGLLERCEYHEEIFDPGSNNHEEAYKYANSLISRNDPIVAVFNGNRRELTDTLSTICNDFGAKCSSCEAWEDD